MPREEPKAYIPTGRTPLRPPTTKTPSSCPSHAVIPMPCHRLTKYDPSIPSLPSSPTHHPNHAIPMPREEPKAYIPTGRTPLRPHPQNTLIPPLPLRQSGLRAGIQSPEAGRVVLSQIRRGGSPLQVEHPLLEGPPMEDRSMSGGAKVCTQALSPVSNSTPDTRAQKFTDSTRSLCPSPAARAIWYSCTPRSLMGVGTPSSLLHSLVNFKSLY